MTLYLKQGQHRRSGWSGKCRTTFRSCVQCRTTFWSKPHPLNWKYLCMLEAILSQPLHSRPHFVYDNEHWQSRAKEHQNKLYNCYIFHWCSYLADIQSCAVVSPDTLYTWVHSYLVCSCYSRSGVCLETWLYYLLNTVRVAVIVLYYGYIVYYNKQARCTVLVTMYNNIMYYTEKLHNFCHGCATAHSMNLHYIQ